MIQILKHFESGLVCVTWKYCFVTSNLLLSIGVAGIPVRVGSDKALLRVPLFLIYVAGYSFLDFPGIQDQKQLTMYIISKQIRPTKFARLKPDGVIV